MIHLHFDHSRRFWHAGHEGVRGTLYVGPMSLPVVANAQYALPTAERADREDGLYDLEFGYITFKSGKKSRAIRLLGSFSRGAYPNSRGRRYIHAGNYPRQVTGCVLPGLREWPGKGVSASRPAMDQIFDALGGWRYHKPCGQLLVTESGA